MKHIYLLTIALVCSLMVNGQTFTIEQRTTGMTQNIFGQGFTPSVQGNGTGTVGTQSEVGLNEFSFMLNADITPDVLYIYEVLPNNKIVLMDGTGGTLVGQSTSKTEEGFWFTNYKFNSLVLNKDKMYYALFREAVSCEVGGGNYDGGNIYRLGSDGKMNTTEYANAKFKASFTTTTTTSIPQQDIRTILIYPNQTKGDIIISSEERTVIDVYALTGAKVKTIKVDRGQSQKSIADLPKGIYIFVSESKKICKVVKK